MADQVFVGVDIGGTKTAIVLAAHPPAVLTRLVFPTQPEDGPATAIESIIESVKSALASQKLGRAAIEAIGVSCGGPLDSARGRIQRPPNLPSWIDVPICALLETAFGAPCYLENDANAGALAEHAFGAGLGTRNMIFLTMGTGIGAGLILDGSLFHGASHAAGEIGHVRLTSSGPRGHNKSGSVEGWASGAGMSQLAQFEMAKAAERGEATLLAASDGAAAPAVTAQQVAAAAAAGDPLAQSIVKTVGQRLGAAMAILVDLLNPECIAVGGLALRFGEAILEPARAVVQDEALAESAALCRILPAALGEQIGDIAALCVAMRGVAP